MDKREKINNLAQKIIYWLIILIPFVASFSSATLNVSIGALITVYLIKKILSRDYLPASTPITIPFLFLMLISLISMRNSSHLASSIQGMAKLLKYGFLFMIISEYVVDKNHFKNVVLSLIFGLLLASLDGIYQLHFGMDFIRRHAYDFDPDIGLGRVKAAFPHTNIYAIYLGLLLPACLSLGLYFYKAKKKLFFIIVSILAVFCLIFTFSRGAVLGFLLAVILMGLIKRDKLLLAAIVIAFAAGPFMLPSTIKDWVKKQDSIVGILINSQSKEREFIFKTSVNMIKHHPFIGVGVNTYCRNYTLYKVAQLEGNTGDRSYYAHNNFLQMAGEIGLIGLSIFFWLLFTLFRKWYIIYKLSPEVSFSKISSLGLILGIFAFLVNGLTESGLYYSKVATIFWLVLGILLASLKE